MVNAKAYGVNQILHDIAALRGQVANLQQNGTFTNLSVSGTTTLNGPLQATAGTAATPSVVTTDNWTYAAMPTNITSGTIRFKLQPGLSVKVNVTIVVGAAAAAGTLLLFTAPSAAYKPAVQQRDTVGFVQNGAPTVAQLTAMCAMRWQANTSGAFNILNFVGGAAGSGVIEISFNCEYALDA